MNENNDNNSINHNDVNIRLIIDVKMTLNIDVNITDKILNVKLNQTWQMRLRFGFLKKIISAAFETDDFFYMFLIAFSVAYKQGKTPRI